MQKIDRTYGITFCWLPSAGFFGPPFGHGIVLTQIGTVDAPLQRVE
jgi:hypothetical protein